MQHLTGRTVEAVDKILAHDRRHRHDERTRLLAGAYLVCPADISQPFHNADWAWLKAAAGILLFESRFVSVLGPIEREAARSAKVGAAYEGGSRSGIGK